MLGTNGLVKQNNFTKIAIIMLDKFIKNCDMICFVIYTCHVFSSQILVANLFFISWFSLTVHCLKAGFVPCPGDKLMVPDLTTRIVSIVDGSYFRSIFMFWSMEQWVTLVLWRRVYLIFFFFFQPSVQLAPSSHPYGLEIYEVLEVRFCHCFHVFIPRFTWLDIKSTPPHGIDV